MREGQRPWRCEELRCLAIRKKQLRLLRVRAGFPVVAFNRNAQRTQKMQVVLGKGAGFGRGLAAGVVTFGGFR